MFPDKELYEIEYSDEARDLIAQLLSIEPEGRQSCDQIINHPWFKDSQWKEIIEQ
jgi:serine/threonine protein kinase